jgi:hypothetical protein
MSHLLWILAGPLVGLQKMYYNFTTQFRFVIGFYFQTYVHAGEVAELLMLV